MSGRNNLDINSANCRKKKIDSLLSLCVFYFYHFSTNNCNLVNHPKLYPYHNSSLRIQHPDKINNYIQQLQIHHTHQNSQKHLTWTIKTQSNPVVWSQNENVVHAFTIECKTLVYIYIYMCVCVRGNWIWIYLKGMCVWLCVYLDRISHTSIY